MWLSTRAQTQRTRVSQVCVVFSSCWKLETENTLKANSKIPGKNKSFECLESLEQMEVSCCGGEEITAWCG